MSRHQGAIAVQVGWGNITPEQGDEAEERAAILEHDAGASRADAEFRAIRSIINQKGTPCTAR